MRMSQEEKDKSHARIVASAARLFRDRGIDGASVADVMNDAGMTHGGFYKHFGSKDELVEAALANAFAEFVGLFGNHGKGAPSASAFAAIATRLREAGVDATPAMFRSLYLSQEHVEQRGLGCPVAALGIELGRGSAKLKQAFGVGVRGMIDTLSGKNKGSASARRAGAIRDFSMMVGAIVIARASDPELADEILSVCGGGTCHV